MLTSSSFNGFGETLTTQPRLTRTTSGGGGVAAGGMDLSYVTERIIALWFPSSVSQHGFRQGQQQAAHMLRNKHGDNYMVGRKFLVVTMFLSSSMFARDFAKTQFHQYHKIRLNFLHLETFTFSGRCSPIVLRDR